MTILSPLQLAFYTSVAIVPLGTCPARDARIAAAWRGGGR